MRNLILPLFRFLRYYYVLPSILILLLTGSILNPTFLSPATLSAILKGWVALGFLVLGESLVILTRGIDLSVGQVACLASVVLVQFMIYFQDPIISIILTLLIGLSIGLFNGTLVNIGIPPFLATLTSMWIAQGLAEYYGVRPTSVPFQEFNVVAYEKIPYTTLSIGLLILIPLLFLIEKTFLGNHIKAIGGNEYSALVSGVNTAKIKLLVYVLSGIFSAIAGFILTSWTTSGYKWIAKGHEFTAIAAAVIGGFSLSGGEGKLLNAYFAMGLLVTLQALYTMLGLIPALFFLTEGIIIFLITGLSMLRMR